VTDTDPNWSYITVTFRVTRDDLERAAQAIETSALRTGITAQQIRQALQEQAS
jgi:hypothetical protein